jgi:predicted negative regulator of RcsB-dependent stress response
VDRLTRKELKTDKFALEVGHSVEYVTEHKKQFIRYGSIAAAIVLIAVVVYGVLAYRAGVRQDALRIALQIQDTPVGEPQTPGQQTYPTEEAKNTELKKALTDVGTKYDGSQEGAIAHYYLGAMAADQGDLAAAERYLRDTIDNGGENYASMAKLSLASVLQAANKGAEGESLLRSLVDNPTTFVSKEQATIALARYIAFSKPEEARKLLEPLRTDRSAISRAALTALSDIPQKK